MFPFQYNTNVILSFTEMISSQKIVAFCLCLLLASFGVVVEAGQGMMGGLGGLFGGGGKNHGGDHGGLGTLLALGILAKLLTSRHGGHLRSGGPAYAAAPAYASVPDYGHAGRGAFPMPDPYAAYQYGMAFQHGYGL